MTTTVKAPRKGLTLGAPKLTRAVKAEAPSSPKAAKPGGADFLVVGGEPRVHLLPPQVIARKRGKAIRRRLGLGVVGVLLVVIVGFGLATVMMISAQSALTDAQAQTTTLLQQQNQYSEVLRVKADVAAIKAAQVTATAQEIAWQPYIAAVEQTLPTGGSISALSVAIDAPFTTPVASTDPLQQPRIATLNLTTSMPQAAISGWLDSLPNLKGFVDANPNSVTLADGGKYTVSVTIHINDKALAKRFTNKAVK